MVTKTKEEVLADLDTEAAKAAEAFKAVIAAESKGVEVIAKWWREFYPKAGHKRLARLLLAVG